MAPKFGTSGLRGKVDELTDGLCADYARAFLSRTPNRGEVLVGRDLRPSSERIAGAVASGARSFGLEVLDCGCLPTPALAMAAIARGAPSVMITGSHIPADRNGLKFYTATGEITKTDETAIAAALAPETAPEADGAGIGLPFPDAVAAYGARYRAAYGPQALRGLRIGLYEHSSVARDLIAALLGDLGAAVVRIGRAGGFVPVDTEAVSADLRAALCEGYADRRRVVPAHLDLMLLCRALTYPGWVIARLGEPGMDARSDRAVAMAVHMAETYLKGR